MPRTLRLGFIEGAEEESWRGVDRPLTEDELRRVLRRYPGDWRPRTPASPRIPPRTRAGEDLHPAARGDRPRLFRHFLELDLWDHNRVLETRVAERTSALQKSLDQLRAVPRQREGLARQLVTAQEEERRRVAGEIHDGPAQTIVALGIRLELLARRLTDPEERAQIERLRATASDALTGLRTLILDLRPLTLEREGLEAALREHLARMEATGGPAISLVADLRSEPPAEAQTVLFRIAREALANAHKHAAASEVTQSSSSTTARVPG